MVGWINSKSGKGGIDDYFLGGKRVQCDDGAESCPDRTKGGTKDIELLNAVSRSNYTMLTMRRPLEAKGSYDVDISTKEEQSIFWSVGYKSAALRKVHKPQKNKSPIYINFGRKPTWNCVENKDEKSSQQKQPDVPRRRMASPSILTPNRGDKLPPPPRRRRPPPPTPSPTRAPPPRHVTAFRPPPVSTTVKPRPVTQTFRPRVHPPRPTRRHVVKRPRTTPSSTIGNLWSDLLSPPTSPEPISGGFKPGSSKSNAVPKIIEETLMAKRSKKKKKSEWDVPVISCQEARGQPVYVQLGPATFHRGNQGVGPGEDGTGIYLNGLLAPDLTLERGVEYTFVIETGLGTDVDETFHPFYITDDEAGGRHVRTELEAKVPK